MHATNVRNLKKNPSLVLRRAKQGPVLVLKGNEPDAVILHLDGVLKDSEAALRPALAASLYRDGTLSLGAAARLSMLDYDGFLQHLAMLGIDVVGVDETTEKEPEDIDQWLASS